MYKVLFLKRVTGVAKEGEIKEVKEGYAINFLFPKKMAVKLTAQEEVKLSAKKNKDEKKRLEVIANKQEIGKILNGKILKFTLKVSGTKNKLFGSIGEKEILAELNKEYDFDFTKKNIDMGVVGHIKKEGSSFVYIKIGGQHIAKITVEVKGV